MATADLRNAWNDPMSIRQARLLQPDNHPKFMHPVVNISKKTIDVGFSSLDHVQNVVGQVGKEFNMLPMTIAKNVELGKVLRDEFRDNICQPPSKTGNYLNAFNEGNRKAPSHLAFVHPSVIFEFKKVGS